MSCRQAIALWLALTEWQRRFPVGSPQYARALTHLQALKAAYPTLTFDDLRAYRRVTQ